MTALMVDLPDCLLQLRSTRSEEERRRSSCQGSRLLSPTECANATRSKASLMSSLTPAITFYLQSSHNGVSCLWVGFQCLDDGSPYLDPLGVKVDVQSGCRLDQLLHLGLQLESLECLVAPEESGSEISFIFGLLLQAVHVRLDLEEFGGKTLGVITFYGLVSLEQ